MARGNGNQPDTSYPSAGEQQKYATGRQRRATIWGLAFMACTMVGIVALTALLFNILNQSFGYVAVQNEVDPEFLVVNELERSLLSTANTVSSEDDRVLAEAIATDPYAIGFFGYAYYGNEADRLRALALDGVEPNADTVHDGSYELSRPLFIYTSARIMEEKPLVAAFVNYYLSNVSQAIGEVGYFPVTPEIIDAGLQRLSAVTKDIDFTEESGEPISTAGSSTVAPVTMALAEQFGADGNAGNITVDVIGTTAGFQRLCVDKNIDIANASRAMNRPEMDVCRKALRGDLFDLRVGADAIAVVVSQENDFLTELSQAELQAIFAGAERWSDVNSDWPDQPIKRHVPGADSGTLDYFVSEVYASVELADLPRETQLKVLASGISAGRLRALDAQQPMAERSDAEITDLLVAEVVKPSIVRSWLLIDSIFHKDEIEAEIAQIPNGDMQFQSWISWDFVTSSQSSDPASAGVRTAILGSLWVLAVCILFSLPLGVGAAIYLEEYAEDSWFSRLVDTNINNLAGVPSIIYGLLGLAIFVRALEPLTSGQFLGASESATTNGRTVISAGLTLGLLILPLIIINAREAIRAVPSSLREASFGLGATRWQTVWNHVLPGAIAGILTGSILAVSRAIGETAPLVVVGASTFIMVDPDGPFAKFTTLPIQIFQWTTRPQAEFRNLAAAASLVLILLLILLNATAVILRNRFSRQKV